MDTAETTTDAIRAKTATYPDREKARTVLEAGVPLAFGSDKMLSGPLYGIHHAVNVLHDEQRLSVAEAVRAYTSGSAYATSAENRKGTLEV